MIAERPVTNVEAASAAPEKGEIARLGRIIYERVRADYDTPENKGKALIVDVDTERCEVVEMDKLAARLVERGLGERRYLVKIGYPTFYQYRNSPRKVVVR